MADYLKNAQRVVMKQSEENLTAESEPGIIDGATHCSKCGALQTPVPSIQVDTMKFWQLNQPEIYWWSDSERARLEVSMSTGDLIVNYYAQSVTIRDSAGRLRNYPRNQA